MSGSLGITNVGYKNRIASSGPSDLRTYFPLEPHSWNPVVLWQMAVNEVVEIVNVVVVTVVVPNANKKRALGLGGLNLKPG